MINFSEFLLTEAETSLRGSLSGADSYKTISHVLRYVVPFLDKDQAKKVIANLGKNVSDPEKAISSHEQIPLARERDFTHTLAKDHEGHRAGTPVKITGVNVRDGKVIAQTEKHGEVPLTKISKPPELKKEKAAKKAWGLEDLVAGNLGGKSAGSSKESHDFAYPPQSADSKTKKTKAKGVVKSAGGEVPSQEEILARGETKGHNGVMGNAKFFWDKDKGWDVRHSNPDVENLMRKAHVNGVPILDHLNINHPDGVINKGFQAAAPQGMSRAYLKSTNSNLLHIHDLDKDVGTTFSIGDELKGKTKLGHLEDSDIDSLDGIIALGKTQNGKTLGFHRPAQKNMKRFATLSADDTNHRTLIDKGHAAEFMKDIDKIHDEKTAQRNNQEEPPATYHPSHGGKIWTQE